MHQFADRFGIARLVEVAALKLCYKFQNLLSSQKGAGELLAMVLSKTQDSDSLKTTLFQIIGCNSECSLKDELLLSEMKQHEPLAWAVLYGVWAVDGGVLPIDFGLDVEE
jgi:hypothetical protein